MKTLIDYILEKNIKYLAIIGLAKNAGKTVTFNQLIREALLQDIKLAVLSYGRDGEEVDAITRKNKPRILLSPGMVFVTAEGAYQKSGLKARMLTRTDNNTLLGNVNIYFSEQEGLIELTGVNSTSKFARVKELLPDNLDLVIIDGALDRRSSAMPVLSDGVVLATGAVVGNTVDLVVKRTMLEYRKLTLPASEDSKIKKLALRSFSQGKGAVLTTAGEFKLLSSRTTFGSIEEIKRLGQDEIDTLFFKGALTDSLLEELVFNLKIHGCRLIVQDGTRVFLNQRNFKLLSHYGLELKVLNKVRVTAVTVNPVSPTGIRLNSSELVHRLRNSLPIPVFDLWSEEYRKLYTPAGSAFTG